MPQMDIVPFNNPQNYTILNAIRGIADSDYQRRVPAATKASIDSALNAMWDYAPARNQFVDALVNVIGAQIVKYNSWTNPLAKYKTGLMLPQGETIEEVAVGLLSARHYNPDAEYLERAIFGREPIETQTRFHKIDRTDMYKLTVNRNMLRRAFLNPGGLSEYINGLMASMTTSDNWDEFLITTSLLKKYNDEDGFFKINVPNVSNLSSMTAGNDAKYILKRMRAMAETLPFLSRKYNAAKMPISAQRGELELIITPEAQAQIDVEALAGAFNIGKAEFASRTTVIPAEYFGFTGVQAILTTKAFWIIMDQFMEMQSANNPAGVYQNFFWHHHELISTSAFVPAILFTSEDAGSVITVQTYPITGISALTITDIINGNAAVTNSQLARGGGYVVSGTALTNPVGGPNSGLTLSLTGNGSTKTRLTQEGVLVVGIDEPNDTITVHAQSTFDPTFYVDVDFAVIGAQVEGSVGQKVDENTAVINNKTIPKINPATGVIGASFTVDPGKWDTPRMAFAYQWSLNGAAISGATQDTYTSTAVGSLTVVVTASKSGFTAATATSNTATVTAS